MSVPEVRCFVNGCWDEGAGGAGDVFNPATGKVIARLPETTPSQVGEAVANAHRAFADWRETPPGDRARCLFRLRELLEQVRDDIAVTLTREHGKTLRESSGEIQRAIENVEVACGVTRAMQGDVLEHAAPGIDEYAIRQPLGVFACLAPFNFPAMIPFWFLPYAVATGNCFIVKPSPLTPMTMERIFELLVEAGFPAGVVQLVHGGERTARALIEHPLVQGISFVGSTPVARKVYAQAAAAGKRVQCQAGAKNFVLIMPDADLEQAADNVIRSAFDCTGQRCLAVSAALIAGSAYEGIRDRLVQHAAALRVGDGMEDGVDVGPLISEHAKERVARYIRTGLDEGAQLALDGREVDVPGCPGGYWVAPTILEDCRPDMSIMRDEIFGPVLCLARVNDLDQALDIIAASPYGNSSAIYTQSGRAAREFKHRVTTGNVGINVGVAAPMAFFHFGGMKGSFFGDLHAQSMDAFQFFTESKVVIERW